MVLKLTYIDHSLLRARKTASFGVRKLNLLVDCTLFYIGEYYWEIYYWKIGKSSFFEIVSDF